MDELVGSHRPGQPAHRRRRAGAGLRRRGRRPRPADRQRRPAARPRRAVAAADPEADHRRADRPAHAGGQPLGDPAVGVGPAAGHRHPGRHRPRPARARGQRPRRGGRAPAAGRATPGPGLGSLVRNLDILNKVTIPRLDGVEQMLVTYPDVVSGGFTVVRERRGVMRSHFGFVLNSDDPNACITGYRPQRPTAEPRRGRGDRHRRSVACAVINGVDPQPGDGYDESGSDIRGEQNIGRSGGSGLERARRARPAGGTRRRPAAAATARAGCCTPTRSPARWADRACRRPGRTRRQGESRW